MAIPALATRPVLTDEQVGLIELYYVVARSRPASFGAVPMPLPITEIRAAYEFLGLSQLYTPLEFWRWMDALDSALIEHYREVEARKPKPKK